MTTQSKSSALIRQRFLRKLQLHTLLVLTHLFVFLTFLSITGCGKTTQPAPTSNSQLLTPDSEPSLRIHWLGKKRLAADPNATNFIAIWNMPESLRLENQTLDKLATAPWRLLTSTVTPLSNAPVALLRPLLDDLLLEESYLEIAADTNRFTEAVLAIKLPPDRAALWKTNLPVISNSIPFLTLSTSGDWTLLSFSEIRPQTSDLRLLPQVRQRLSATGTPCDLGSANDWLHGNIDFHWLKRVFGWRSVPDNSLPRCGFSIIGEAGKVRTSAKFTFPSGAPFELEPWNIPTNLVHDPLSGFMAVRGIRPLLKSCGLWDESKLGDTPNQATFWSQSGHPALRFFAMPSQQSSNQMELLSKYLLTEVNPKMAIFPNTTNVPIGLFEPIPGSQRLRWHGIPYIVPSLDVATTGSQDFITGGLFSNRITNDSAPDSLLGQFKNDSSILLYDWETSQATTYALIQISQTIRFVFGLNRFSMTNNAALPWIVAVSPKLDTSGTSIRLTSTNAVTLTRSSTIGLTGIEIHLLSEWLESPDFPKGLFSISSKPTPQNSTRSGTP